MFLQDVTLIELFEFNLIPLIATVKYILEVFG